MSLIDNILMALSSLKSNKMRSLLTMLGIIIGISSVITIVTIGQSLKTTMQKDLSSFGANDITVMLQNKSEVGKNDDFGEYRFFTREDFRESDLMKMEMLTALKDAYPQYIKGFILQQNIITQQEYKSNHGSAKMNLLGVSQLYQDSNTIEMVTGRFISDIDVAQKRNVVAVSDTFAKQIFGSVDAALHQTVSFSINGFYRELYIVGVYQYKDLGVLGRYEDPVTNLYMPVSTGLAYLNQSEGYYTVTVVVNSALDVEKTTVLTQQFLSKYYKNNDTYTVNASNLKSALDQINNVLSALTLAISSIAAISLLVGGIGVMNIMLVSITERTKEIGTRKALGATQNMIRMQFIIESIIICLIGGIIGIVSGLLFGSIGSELIGYKAVAPIGAIVLSVLFSMAVGMFFGYYPANKAAKLNPIDALRYE